MRTAQTGLMSKPLLLSVALLALTAACVERDAAPAASTPSSGAQPSSAQPSGAPPRPSAQPGRGEGERETPAATPGSDAMGDPARAVSGPPGELELDEPEDYEPKDDAFDDTDMMPADIVDAGPALIP